MALLFVGYDFFLCLSAYFMPAFGKSAKGALGAYRDKNHVVLRLDCAWLVESNSC